MWTFARGASIALAVQTTMPGSVVRRTRASCQTRTLSLAASAAVAATLCGCIVLQSEHQALARNVHEIDRRTQTIETAERDRRQQLERADEQVRALNAQLEQTRAQTRDLADLGARLDGIDEEIRRIRGGLDDARRTLETRATDSEAQRHAVEERLAALERRLLELERRAGLAPAVDAQQIPALPADILALARTAAAARDFVRARALTAALLERAPHDALADDARLLNARMYVQENRNATAVQELQRLLTDFPAGDTVPDALTELAEALVRLGLCGPAQRTLRILVERHGSTPQGAAARRRLDELRHLPRAACTG